MQGLALQDVLIADALANGTIEVEAMHNDRINSDYWAVRDKDGTIEVFLSEQEAEDRIAAVLEMVAQGQSHVA